MDVAAFSLFTVVVIPGKWSGERLQDHWSSGYTMSWLKCLRVINRLPPIIVGINIQGICMVNKKNFERSS